MPFSVRRELLGAEGAVHGGLDYAKLRSEGVEPESILDFSVSTNPLPLHPEVERAVARAVIDRYPDSSSGELRLAIAEENGVSPEEVLVTNGLAQAVFLAAFAFCDRGSTVLVASPTFGEYEAASLLAGAEVVHVPARQEEGFAFPLERLMDGVREHCPALVWVCSPNNPTGVLLSQEERSALLRVCEESPSPEGGENRRGTLLLLDEAYVNFAPPGASALPPLATEVHVPACGPFVTGASSARVPHPTETPLAVREPGLHSAAGGDHLPDCAFPSNLLLFRSMTKDYGLTGLRLGYILGSRQLLRPLSALQPPWSVNACAQAAGVEALRQGAYYSEQWCQIHFLTEKMAAKLRAVGYAPSPPSANFLLFFVGDTAALAEFLWRDRILVRDCASFGLPGYVRVGVRSEAENDRLVERLGAFRQGGGA